MSAFEPKQFGKYFLLEKLAVGGMAEIYKAKTFGVDGFEKQQALKRILPHCSADKDFITMLVDEAKLSVQLSHANIVQVYDLGKVGDDYFISMEFINGPNLRDILYKCREQNIKLPTELVVYIISEVCKGLDYAHRKTDQNNRALNIVHRDVSPQNILISYEGEVKIVDFGIAKAAMNISHTMAGILKGKIAYMSPEQALGKTIDSRTDIFSLGIVLYEILTQKKLFSGESQFEVLKKIRTTKVNESMLPKEIPDTLKAIIAKTLSYYAKDRYQTAGDMQIDLTKFLYQSYFDFTPQKLASFIKDLFKNQLMQQQKEAAREANLAAQTSSININQEALQENIVHREDTGVTMKAADLRPLISERDDEGSVAASVVRYKRKRTVNTVISLLLFVAIISGIGLAYWKWLHPIWFGPPIPTTATVNINSSPAGAKILIDGEDTGFSTPAIVENLELNKDYKLKLRKDGFADLFRIFIARSTEPLNLNYTLSKEMGTLEIISSPIGAEVFINDENTEKLTPTTITNFELKKEFKLVLKKEDYIDFEKNITLQYMDPVKIEAELEKILYANIEISSNPDGAAIYIDDKNTGKTTPAKIEKIELKKEHTIKLVKNGYITFEKKITPENEAITVAENLKEKPEPAQTSDIYITSSPSGATIYLAGRNTGKKTPATISGVTIGKTYTIKLTKPNFKTFTKKVYISSTEKQSLQGTLVARTTKQDQTTDQGQQTKDQRQQTTDDRTGKTVTGSGTLKVSSSPSGATVFINGESRGTTPFSAKVPAGRVKIVVTKAGKGTITRTVTVKPGQTTNLGNLKLAGTTLGTIYVNSTPPNASVTVNGQAVGNTPISISKVKTGVNYTLTVSYPGYKTSTRSFTLEGAKKNFHITLDK